MAWKRPGIAAVLALAGALSPLSIAAQTPVALPEPTDAAEEARLDWYRYDASLPLRATLTPRDTTPVSIRFSLFYDSVHDQRVPAIVALPKRQAASYPAVILVHGSGGNKDTSYIKALSEALTRRGYVTLAIDTQYHGDRKRTGRSGEIHMPDSFTMRDAWVQSVIDVRRAVDYLYSRPDIDRSRIGYLGFSQGAMLGSVVGGVEPRIDLFCLAVPGGGIVDIVRHIDRYPVLKAHWPISVTPDVMKTVEDVANITDPLYYIGRIAPRPLLILVAKYDEIIPAEASEALVRAARNDAALQVKEINSGHVLNPNVIFDIRDYFDAHFGRHAAGRSGP